MNPDERIVITGLGLTTPLGHTVAEAWERCLSGRSGIGACTRFDTGGHACHSAGLVPAYDLKDLRAPKNQKFMNAGARHLVQAAQRALEGASFGMEAPQPSRVAVHVGSGRVGPEPSEFFRAFEVARDPDGSPDWDQLGGRASRLVDPYFPLRTLSNSGAALLAMEICARGPSSNFVQSDLASALALNAAFWDLKERRCDLAIAGGFDCLATPASYLAFEKRGLLSRRRPDEALRPFDREADGLVLGEGAAVLVLERLSDARKRSAPVLAEIGGVTTAVSASHLMQPFPDSGAISASVRRAATGDPFDFVVASGFGVPDADYKEAAILTDLVGNQIPVTAFKGLTSYLGAATALVEIALGVMALNKRCIPPVARHRQPAEGVGINLVSQPIALEENKACSALFLSNSWTGQSAAVYLKAGSARIG
jgi:3-oxoacyl-[acyl-carrier-protein] synthase II